MAQNKESAGGGEPALEASPSQVVFTDITPADGIQTDVVTLENVGNALLTLDALTIDGAGDWTVLEGPAVSQLEPGEQTTVTVAWSPITTESEAQLVIPSNDADSPALIDLLGTSILPELVVQDTSFGEGHVDCSVYNQVTVENVGGVDATIVDLAAADERWTVDDLALPLVLPPGDVIVVGVTWNPGVLGAEERGTLTVEEQTVGPTDGSMTGMVVAHPVRLSPRPVGFDPVYVDCEDVYEVEVYNDSSCDVTLTELVVDLEAFTPDVTDLPVIIPAEGVAAFDVTFQPTERRRYVSVLEAVVEGQRLEVDISGEGVQNQFSETFDVVEPAEEPIYAHSSNMLYSYDPTTGMLSTIGSTGAVLFDIAIDAYGQLWGIDMSGSIYQVDSATGVATSFMPTPAYGNGLAVLQDGSLVVSNSYTLAEIDWSTGNTTALATSSWGLSSGDVVEWDGYLYWTVTEGGADNLLEYDTATGTLSNLGSTGVYSLWGLVAPDGDLYAFSADGTIYELDSSTGAVLGSTSTSANFYGAAHNPSYGAHPGWVFTLRQTPASEDDIEVEINGVATTAFDWDPATNQVEISDPTLMTGGDTVEIMYYLASECD